MNLQLIGRYPGIANDSRRYFRQRLLEVASHRQRRRTRNRSAGACTFLVTAISLACSALATPTAVAEIRFTETTALAGIRDTGESIGAAWNDVDGDGYPDLWLDKHQYTPTVIYLNRGDGTFAESIEDFDEPWGILGAFEGRTDSHGRAWADFDNDGDDDVLEVSDLGWDNLFWINDGFGHLENRMATHGFVYPFDASICSTSGQCNPWGRRMPLWFDYNNDGALDVMVSALVDYAPPYSPTAIFRQTTKPDGAKSFVYAKETGVDYDNAAFCRFGVLAELSGDDRLDLICADSAKVSEVWDTSQLPFLSLRGRLGPDLYRSRPADFAVGDFNGDLLPDIFVVRPAISADVAQLVGTRNVHARFVTKTAEPAKLSFAAEGSLVIDFDWWTDTDDVFIGASRANPPSSANLSVYNGWNNYVRLTLSPTDARNQGIGLDRAPGYYIGYVDGRWVVRFVNHRSSWPKQLVIQASGAISNLLTEGGLVIGQRANTLPALLLQNAAHQLVNHSNSILGPQSSCISAVAGDFDNDGDLDVFTGCSGEIANLDNILYENDGLGNFTAITGSKLGKARGDLYGRTDTVITADYDQDGRLDLFVTNGRAFRPYSIAGRQQLFRNVSNNDHHWVEVDLRGVTTNRNGIGARVFASTPDGKVQVREQDNGMHRDGQNHRRLHFGLGRNTTLNLEVRWPSGIVDHFNDVGVDRLHTLTEGADHTEALQ